MTLVRYEVSDDVAVITVDNPPVNALSPGVPGGIIDGLRQANSDSSIFAVAVSYTHLTLPTILLV